MQITNSTANVLIQGGVTAGKLYVTSLNVIEGCEGNVLRFFDQGNNRANYLLVAVHPPNEINMVGGTIKEKKHTGIDLEK